MQSGCKTIEITDQEVLRVFANPVIENAFDHSGWIAGGFPRLVGRTILRSHRLDNVSDNKTKLFQQYFQRGGDIDFFFQNASDFKNAITKGAYHQSAFAHNVWLYNNGGVLSVKVQLVNKFYYDNIEKTFESFDFLNSCYAIKREDRRYYLVYDICAARADEMKELIIKNSNSPYTLQRVVKYVNSGRGIETVSAKSLVVLRDLIIKSAAEIFDKKYIFKITKPFVKHSLDFMFDTGLINSENAIYFIGKFKRTYTQRYGPAYTVDWASEIIEKSVST